MKDDNFSSKSALERAVLAGIYGPPELKREERRYYLGQFRERVIKVLTFAQIAEPGIYSEIQDAMAHPLARRVIISRRAVSAAKKYVQLARKYNLEFTTVDSPDYTGPVGLVVAAGQAVDEAAITIPGRRERLLALGIPQEIIDSPGKTLCKACLDLLREKAPEEAKRYRRENIIDRFLGNRCPCKTRTGS